MSSSANCLEIIFQVLWNSWHLSQFSNFNESPLSFKSLVGQKETKYGLVALPEINLRKSKPSRNSLWLTAKSKLVSKLLDVYKRQQLEYNCCENIVFSDHRPVYATFRARVTVVDEQKKTTLGTQIYERIMEKLDGLNDDEKIAVLSDDAFVIESFEDNDSVAGLTHSPTPNSEPKRGRKLPPPSSDMKKWWIGSGKQVKVVLDVDPAVYMINPERDPNPFLSLIHIWSVVE